MIHLDERDVQGFEGEGVGMYAHNMQCAVQCSEVITVKILLFVSMFRFFMLR